VRSLKQLQLHGYKTFAARTDFLFDVGVTAIVGPNGSGKSNVADALRWVLGEQSFSALRGKRTEDMIFSGSEQRARLGMAHASLILDNSTGWLPVDFTEVEIARRAYRSGENEYFLNGNRVRLRDITELLGSSGLSERTYTVIGQGLIDQALSLRPEERRRLFEEAAGITVHQAKRDQAVQKLAETRVNLTRAQDIISELAPRLRYLKGQARRASEYQQLKADLTAHLHTWYGYKWRLSLLALDAAKDRAAESARVAAEQADALDELLGQSAARQNERTHLRDQLGEWHRIGSRLHRQAETVQRELAVRSEQVRLWGDQRAELERELGYLRATLEDGAERRRAAEEELAEAQAGHQAHASYVAAAQAALSAGERARQAQTQRVTQAQDALLTAQTRQAELRSRLTSLGERRAELARAEEEQLQAGRTAAAQLKELEAQAEVFEAQVAAAQAELAQAEQSRQSQGAALAAAQDAERRATEQLIAAQRALGRLQDQHDMLSRLRDEGAGLNAGARAVLSARRGELAAPTAASGGSRSAVGGLSGIVGALGDLIEAPPELERAIEAALGGRVQDVVVRRWEDAEAGVAYLKRTQAGRATFLPLDNLRPSRPADAPRMVGVLGLATDLVKFDPTIRPAVELVLNHVVIVEDLPTTRKLLARDGRATLVTLEGEIVRPGGSVTGGSEGKNRDSGVLSRARALRELPPQIAATAAEVREREARLAQARRDQETARTALNSLRSRRDEITARQGRVSDEANRVGLAVERARQTRDWHEERRKALVAEANGLTPREIELRADLANLNDQVAAGEAALEVARRDLRELATDDLMAELARVRAEAAVSAGQLQDRQARVADLHDRQQQRNAEIAAKETRLASLDAQGEEAQQAVIEHSAAAQALTQEITALDAQIEPAEARLAVLERQGREAEAHERGLREQLRVAQMRQSQADLALQRSQDELTHLRGEIEKELGLVVLEGDDQADAQPPLPLNGMITRLAPVAQLPEGLEGDVRNLRAQISRLGPVNLDALAEYNEVEARHNFLTTQAADLEKAITALEEIIVELEQVMEREFLATFKAVAAQFKEEFTNLFGGGSARLQLADPDNPSASGVEIVARPPGKREQGLALLSGGERALTAAALIFSILKVRPTPFCVLDEVDAALDEANVTRFRDALKALSKQTQFILITHNRGTIEVADTIYGVSMGADNTSQVLSLKLDGHEVVPAKATES
jgi:chromosome segregation protein